MVNTIPEYPSLHPGVASVCINCLQKEWSSRYAAQLDPTGRDYQDFTLRTLVLGRGHVRADIVTCDLPNFDEVAEETPIEQVVALGKGDA